MAGHDADDGQRDRRHDDQRHQVAAELRDHQQVDQDQADTVGDPHVAEGLVGDLPLAVPFDAVLVGVLRRAQVPLGQPEVFGQLSGDLEQAVERAVGLAGHVADHVDHRQQILVVDAVGPLGLDDRDDLRQRHQLPAHGAHAQAQYLLQVGLVGLLVFDADGHGVFDIGPVQEAHVLAVEHGVQGLRDAGLLDPEAGGLGAIHHDQELIRRVFDRVVDVDDIGGVAEGPAHLLGDGDLARIVDAVDLSHQRREHRRSGRDLDDLGVAVVLACDGLQWLAQAHGDGVALVVAMVLVDQVDLDVAQMRALAQIVLAHQAVEVDRRGGAGVDLIVGHLRHAGQVIAHLREHAGGLLQAGALGHVQHYLELALVVERQHLQDDQLVDGEQHRARDQDQDARQQQPAVEDALLAFQKRTDDATEKAKQRLAAAFVVLTMGAMPGGTGRRGRIVPLAEHEIAHPGCEHEGHHQRDQHAHGGIDRDRAHVRPHQAGDEGHRQQCRDDGEGCQDGRTADLIHRARHQLQQPLARPQRHVSMDVLDHDDGVVHQDADGEDQREQRHAIEREAVGPGCEQRERQRDHHRGADDDRLAPADGEPDQRHHRDGREGQLGDQLLGLVVGGLAVVARDADLDPLGDEGAVQLLNALHHALGDVYRVGAFLFGHGDGHRGC